MEVGIGYCVVTVLVGRVGSGEVTVTKDSLSARRPVLKMEVCKLLKVKRWERQEGAPPLDLVSGLVLGRLSIFSDNATSLFTLVLHSSVVPCPSPVQESGTGRTTSGIYCLLSLPCRYFSNIGNIANMDDWNTFYFLRL